MASFRSQVYSDASFNPGNSLGDLRDLPPQSKEYILSNVTWHRVEEVMPNFGNSFLKHFDPDAIRGNPSLPNYTFWRVLKHLASFPELVRSLFVVCNEDNRGRFLVYVGNGPDSKKDFEVDTRLPFVTDQSGNLIPAFCQIGNEDIWPLIFEKAVLKAMGTSVFFSTLN